MTFASAAHGREASLRLRDAYGADARGVGDRSPLRLLLVGEQRG